MGKMTKKEENYPKEKLFSEEMDGYWQTEGYNYILSIKEGIPTVYEFTKISCIKIEGFMAYLEPSSPSFKASISSEGKLICENIGTINYITAKRINELPSVPENGQQGNIDDPQRNFEVFWHAFDECYPFFEKRNIDWNELRKKFSSLIKPNMKPDALHEIMHKMLLPLNDIHTFIKRNEKKFKIYTMFPQWAREPIANADNIIIDSVSRGKWKGAGGKIAEVLEEAFSDFLPIIKQNYLKGKFEKICNGMIMYGKLDASIGYIYLAKVEAYASDEDCDIIEDIIVLNDALDMIIEELDDVKTIILDDRFCLGGDDSINLAITTRFTDKRRMVQIKQAKGVEGLSPLRKIYVEPSGKNVFKNKKVIILTSKITISGGETLAIMMSAIPNVTFIGESGPGILSDTIKRHLPNGWQFYLPMEIIYDHNGRACEVEEFPLDITVPLDREGFKQGRDKILEKAIEIALVDM